MKKLNLSCKLIIVLICLMSATFHHCGPRKQGPAGDNNSVVLGYWGDETIFCHDHWGMEAAYLMFLPLVSRTEDESGEARPLLAEQWEHSEDYRTWTFHLRTDVKWHDASPFIAQDIAFTLDLRKKLYEVRGNPLPESLQYTVRVLDDSTISITYPAPTDGLNTYEVYYPKHLLEGLDPEEFRDWEFWKAPVGNGPYRYVRHVPKTLVELEANPDYFRGKPKIERAILKFIESDDSYFTELSSGNVDAISYVSLDMPLKLAHDDRFRFYYWWGTVMGTIYWNNRHPLMNRPKIRRALTMAINRSELPGIYSYPCEVPILDTIVTNRLLRRSGYPSPYPHDPEAARRLLEEEGWSDSDGNGLLDRGGEEFRFQLTLTDHALEPGAIFAQAELRKIGVTMDIQYLPRPVLIERFRAGNFDAVLHHFTNEISQPNWGQIRIFGRESPLGYDNPEMDRLLRLAEKTFDPGERDRIFQSIMPLFQEDLPATFLVPEVQLFAAHKRIKGLSNIFRVDPVMFLEYLWIEEED